MRRFGLGTLLLAATLLPQLASAGLNVTNGLTHELVVQAGNSYEGVITVVNTGDAPEDVKFYQTDYLFRHDGSNIYGEPGSHARSNASWISFSPDRATIPAGGSVTVSYTVRVPSDAPAPGTSWSMLMVEPVPATSPESVRARENEVTLGLQQIFRFGIQMITTVGDAGSSELRFLDTRLVRATDARTFEVDVENTGERYLRLALWTEIFDDSGRSLGRFEGGRLRTYPGTSVRFRVDLSAVPPGRYKALVVADGGGENVFGASYTLKLGQ